MLDGRLFQAKSEVSNPIWRHVMSSGWVSKQVTKYVTFVLLMIVFAMLIDGHSTAEQAQLHDKGDINNK